MQTRAFWKRLAICGAISTWCFLNCWVELGQMESLYLRRYHPRDVVMLPLLCLQVLLTVVLMLVSGWPAMRRRRMLWLPFAIVPFGFAMLGLLLLLPFRIPHAVVAIVYRPAAIVLVVMAGVWILRWRERALDVLGTVFLYSVPVLGVIVGHAGVILLPYPTAEFDDGPTAAVSRPPRTDARVVWIIFDELSGALAFDRRPASLQLPEFDRLRGESVAASQANSPANATLVSIPALLDGFYAPKARSQDPGELRLDIAQGSRNWAASDTVFEYARGLGYKTAMTGWYHPYGRVLNERLNSVAWVAKWQRQGAEEPFRPMSLVQLMGLRLRLQAENFPFMGRLGGSFRGSAEREAKVEKAKWLMARSEAMASDATNGLVVLHLPAPHPPAIFHAATRSWQPNRLDLSYADSLAQADMMLGRIRAAMERNGLWSSSAVVVTSDHGWRPSIWRELPDWRPADERLAPVSDTDVPFLVKLPNQSAPLRVEKPYSTVRTRALVEGILSGRYVRAEQVAAWMESR